MNDLISRSALLELSFPLSPCTVDNPYNIAAAVLVDDIEAAPAVDAVEVVRCKDCRKRNTVNCPMEEQYFEYPWQATKHHDFCSYGERKTE